METNELPSLMMVVEDSPEDFEALRRAIKKLEVEIPLRHFESGDAALEHMKETLGDASSHREPPALILLDLNLPGTDGRSVLKVLKSNPRWRHIPVMIFTTSNDDRDISDCYNSGANCYVQKPVNMETLVEVLGHLVNFWFRTAILPTNSTK